MANVRVTWKAPTVKMPEGTPAEDHYVVHLGTMTAPVAIGQLEHTFAAVDPGDYPLSMDHIAVDGTVLGTFPASPVHVPLLVDGHPPADIQAVVV